MTEEAFIKAIQADPNDDGSILVYADWLEEHGDNLRAEYLRLFQQIRSAPKRMKEIAKQIGRKWITKLPIMEMEATGMKTFAVVLANETVRVKAYSFHDWSGLPTNPSYQFYVERKRGGTQMVARFNAADVKRIYPVEEE